MASVPQMYSDQFEQAPVRGDLDLAITRSGVLTGILYSASSTDTFAAGDRVKLYSSSTKQGAPVFVACADNAEAFGVIKRVMRKATFVVGDVVEIAFQGGPCVYEVAAATVTPGMTVEMASGFVQEVSAGKPMGLAIDYALVSNMLRVILGHVAC